MKRIGVVYATVTKHSHRIARAIGEALGVDAKSVDERPALKDLDLLFIVGGIYAGKSLPKLLKYVGDLDASGVKAVALVTSCASKEHRQDEVRRILEQKGVGVVDEILCQASFLCNNSGRPNQADVDEAVAFALRLAGD
ncbi:MAG: flavodoxin domain-containing protein [Bacillota bacterium]